MKYSDLVMSQKFTSNSDGHQGMIFTKVPAKGKTCCSKAYNAINLKGKKFQFADEDSVNPVEEKE